MPGRPLGRPRPIRAMDVIAAVVDGTVVYCSDIEVCGGY
jgi:hypothetical protein